MFDEDVPQVEYDENEREWTLRRGKKEVLFQELVMTVAYGDPMSFGFEDSAVSIVGRQVDQTINIIFVAAAMFEDLLSQMINLKDHFCIRRCLLPEEPESHWDLAASIEGLSYYRYEAIPESRSNKKRPISDPSQWPCFRNWDLTATLDLILKEKKKELPNLATAFDKDAKDGKIAIWPGCLFESLAMSVGDSIKEALMDSRIVSILYAYDKIRPHKRFFESPIHRPKPWYKGDIDK